MTDGTCSACATYYRPDSIIRTCIQDPCQNNEIYDNDGYCVDCPDYQIAISSNTACAEPTCGTGEIVLVNGSCSACSSQYRPDSNKRNCIQD